MRENRVRSLALDFKAMARTRGESHRCRIVSCGFTVAHSEFSGQTTYEGLRPAPGALGCARSVRLESSSQKRLSQYCDTEYLRYMYSWLRIHTLLISGQLLHLVEHVGERRLQAQRLLDLIRSHVWVLSVLQEAGEVVLAHELHE